MALERNAADDHVWSHELWHARTPWKLDLHDGLSFAAIMQVVHTRQTAVLADVLHIDGVPLRISDPNELIAVLATHGSTEIYLHRLLRLVELVLVIRRAESLGRLDWDAVDASLASRGTRRFAYPLLVLTEQLAPGTVPAPMIARLRADTTRRIRDVTSRFTPTSPILELRFSLSQRLLWTSGVRATARRLHRCIESGGQKWLVALVDEGRPEAGRQMRDRLPRGCVRRVLPAHGRCR